MNNALISIAHRSYKLLAVLACLGCFPDASRAGAPPAPANVEVRTSPAELLFTWDPSPGADYYKVYRGGPNRRWVPLPEKLVVPRFRESDFTVFPTYYQIVAGNADGQTATAEIVVNGSKSGVEYYGHIVRQVSESAVSLTFYTVGSLNDAMLEVGNGTNGAFYFAHDGAYTQEHEFFIPDLAPDTSYWFRLTLADTNKAGVVYRNSFTTRPYVEPVEISASIVPPVPLVIETEEDALVPILLSATLPSGLPAQFSVTAPPYKGRLSGTPPHLVYAPGIASRFTVFDMFTCSVTDGIETYSAQVRINVRPRNHAPYIRDDAVTKQEDTAASVTVRIEDLEGEAVSNIVVSSATNGTIIPKGIWEPGVYNYFPKTNFNGVDHFTVAGTDGISTGNVAVVRMVVLPVNDPPVVFDQSLIAMDGVPFTFALNATDPEGDSLQLSFLAGPVNGNITRAPGPGMMVTYTLKPGSQATTDSFTYQVFDGSNARTATVQIFIPGPPSAPGPLSAGTRIPGQIDLAWKDNSWNEDWFVLERSNDNKSWKTIATLSPNITAFSDSNLTGNKTFSYRVKAINALGTSDYSNVVSLKATR